MPSNQPELSYAPPVPWYQQRVWQRRLLVLVVIGAVVVPLCMVWHRAWTIIYYHECRWFAVPEGTPAFECDPKRVPALLATGRYRCEIDGDRTPGWQMASLVAGPWDRFATMCRPNWRGWGPRVNPPILFLGEMRTDRGNRRLVAVSFEGWVDTGSLFGLQLDCLSVLPAGAFSPVDIGGAQQVFASEADRTRLARSNMRRILFGRVDPADPSHLIIDVQTMTQTIQLHGHLREKGRWRENVLEFDGASDTSFDQPK